MKPENVLLGQDGHIVLTDFGLSRHLLADEKAKTFCGTAEYLAPEILMSHSYTHKVDWWSLGTFLYEMLSGITPFWCEQPLKMYQRILTDPLVFPNGMDPLAVDLISRMLERDPRLRIDINEIRAHPFFKNVSWHLLLQKKLVAPFIPKLVDTEDVRYFDKMFTDMPAILTPNGTNGDSVSSSMQQKFQGFSIPKVIYRPNDTHKTDDGTKGNANE